MQRVVEKPVSPAQDITSNQLPSLGVDLKDLFRLPEKFPHERYQVRRYLSGEGGVLCFQAYDKVERKDIFVKFLSRPTEFAGIFQDFKYSFCSSEPAIVPSLALFDTVQHFLQHDERGPHVSSAEVQRLQLLGFEEYMGSFVNDPRNTDIQFKGFWVAIIKEYVPGIVPLHKFTGKNESWVGRKVTELVELLASKGLVVRDLLIRPNGSLSGNILIIPEEQRVCISDLEYSDLLPIQEAKRQYQLLMEDFERVINGDKLRDVGKFGRPFFIWD